MNAQRAAYASDHADDLADSLPLDRPFTSEDAQAAGVIPWHLARLHRRGVVRQPIKGVYLHQRAGDSTALRCAALSLVMPADCVVVDRHAARLLGAPTALAPNEHLDLQPIRVFRPSGHGRLRNDIADSGERDLRPGDVMEIDGLAVTTPLRTAWDLGRSRFPETSLAGVDVMLRLGVDKDEMLDGIERFRGQRWVRTLRLMGPLSDGRAESPGESVLRLRWHQAHLPEPTPQLVVVTPGYGNARLDLGNADLAMGAEYDGAEWHSSPEQQEHDRGRRTEITACGYLVDAFVAANVFGHHQDAEHRLRALASRAQRRLEQRVTIL